MSFKNELFDGKETSDIPTYMMNKGEALEVKSLARGTEKSEDHLQKCLYQHLLKDYNASEIKKEKRISTPDGLKNRYIDIAISDSIAIECKGNNEEGLTKSIGQALRYQAYGYCPYIYVDELAVTKELIKIVLSTDLGLMCLKFDPKSKSGTSVLTIPSYKAVDLPRYELKEFEHTYGRVDEMKPDGSYRVIDATDNSILPET